MDEKRFWSMIDEAWNGVEGAAEDRLKLAAGKLSEEDAADLASASWMQMVPALEAALDSLSQEELFQFDRILERKLYDIDRSDIHEYTDGGDDGFLYSRGFIVAAGQGYYDAVSKNPSRAKMELECEDLCYLPTRIYEEKFGDLPASGISRETGSNASGWSEGDD